ncbi:MAG: transglutaminase family protein [Candidatus Brocadiia bacterium]
MNSIVKITFCIVSLCACFGCSAHNNLSLSNVTEKPTFKYTVKSVCEEILATPEDKLDFGRYVILLSKVVNPNINIENELRRLDNMADAVRPRLKGVNKPKEIIRVLNKYLFEDMKFKATGIKKMGNVPMEQIMVPYVLGKREGTCVPLSIIYLCLAERLDLPIYGVTLPKHFFVRYDDGETRINIDPVKKGIEVDDNSYLKIFAPLVKDADLKIKEMLLRNLSRKEILGEYLGGQLIREFIDPEKMLNYKQAVEYENYSIELFPNYSYSYVRKGTYIHFLWEENGKKDANDLNEALQYVLKAYNLYPYDLYTIVAIILIYNDMNNCQECLKMIDELYQKFSLAEVAEICTSEANDDIMFIKQKCRTKLEDRPVPK